MPGFDSHITYILASSAGSFTVTSGTRSASTVTNPSSLSLQGLEKISDGGQLRARQIELRHQIARLYVLRVRDPAGEIADRVRQGAGGDRAAAHQVAEIGAEAAHRRRAVDRMADPAMRNELNPPLGFERRLRGGGAFQLVRPPSVELLLRLRDDGERHVGVLQAAIFGALAAIETGPVGFDPGLVLLARDQIHLARQLRHPERVDDVDAGQFDPYRLAGRDVDLVGGLEAAAGVSAVVTDLPPPLVADDMDRQSGRTALRAAD